MEFTLITEKLGSLKFATHFNAEECSPYEAMVLFESNNWKMLGETSYSVSGDDIGTATFTGVNASAELACFVEGVDLDIPNVD